MNADHLPPPATALRLLTREGAKSTLRVRIVDTGSMQPLVRGTHVYARITSMPSGGVLPGSLALLEVPGSSVMVMHRIIDVRNTMDGGLELLQLGDSDDGDPFRGGRPMPLPEQLASLWVPAGRGIGVVSKIESPGGELLYDRGVWTCRAYDSMAAALSRQLLHARLYKHPRRERAIQALRALTLSLIFRISGLNLAGRRFSRRRRNDYVSETG